MTEAIRFTDCRHSGGYRVGKLARIVAGAVKTSPEGKAHPDTFKVLEFGTPREVANFADSLGPDAYIVAGVPKCGATSGLIVPKAQRVPPSPLGLVALALSDEDFGYSAQPGIMLLDFDPKTIDEGWRPELGISIGGYADVLGEVAPGLMECFARHPSSSCIEGAGVEPRGIRGYHHAVFVQDASDIPRAGDVLFKRLVISGYGYAFVTRAGTPLLRSIVDKAVWRPAQPLFIGGVALSDGLRQDRRPYISFTHDAAPIDTRAVLPDLE